MTARASRRDSRRATPGTNAAAITTRAAASALRTEEGHADRPRRHYRLRVIPIPPHGFQTDC
jgi:hypothetical protein